MTGADDFFARLGDRFQAADVDQLLVFALLTTPGGIDPATLSEPVREYVGAFLANLGVGVDTPRNVAAARVAGHFDEHPLPPELVTLFTAFARELGGRSALDDRAAVRAAAALVGTERSRGLTQARHDDGVAAGPSARFKLDKGE